MGSKEEETGVASEGTDTIGASETEETSRMELGDSNVEACEEVWEAEISMASVPSCKVAEVVLEENQALANLSKISSTQ